MKDLIIIAILVLIIGSAVYYILREKRRGAQCIGCPSSKTCSGKCASCQGCSKHQK